MAPDFSKTPWMDAARHDLGVERTHTGNGNPVILNYAKLARCNWVHTEKEPWCAIFVGAKLAEVDLPNTGDALAMSYKGWGTELSEPKYGCIAVKTRLNDGVHGHVGFVQDWTDTTVTLLNGNVGDKVCYATFPRELFVWFGWPKGASIVEDQHTQAVDAEDEAEAEPEASEASSESTETVVANTVDKPQSASEAVAYLRASGSRTIAASDNIDKATKWGTALTALAAVLSSLLKQAGEYLPHMIGAAVLAFILWEVNKIIEARVDDHVTGKNKGR